MNFKILKVNRHRMYSDGEGIRTLVALSSCPLKCKYCINEKVIKKNQYKEISPQELLEYVIIDYCYFVATNGGITFGGGEPLLQYKAIKEFREILPKDISITIQTSLNVPLNYLTEIVNDVDMFIIDIKTLNESVYKKYTKRENLFLLKNLAFIIDNNLQHKCVIRIPNIPNYTTKQDIENTISIIKEMGFTNLDIFDYIKKKE